MDNSRPFAPSLEDLVESTAERRKQKMRAATKKAAGKAIARRNTRKRIVAKAIEQKRSERENTIAKPRGKRALLGKRKVVLPALFGVALLCVLGIVAIRVFGGKKLDPAVADIYRNDALIAVKQDGLYGYINLNGKMVIEPEFSYARDFHGDYALVNRGAEGAENYQIIDRKKNQIVAVDFASDVYFDVNGGYWSVEGKYYDINMKELAARPAVREMTTAPEDYSTTICDTGVGLMNGKRSAIACQWDSIEFFDGELRSYLESRGKHYVYAKRGEKTAILDTSNGATVVDFTGNMLTDRYSTFVRIQNGGSSTLYNLLTGKTLTVTAQTISLQPLYARVDFADHSEFYNKDLKKIFTQE